MNEVLEGEKVTASVLKKKTCLWMGRRMSDYINLEESGAKEWHCFKEER